MCGIAGYTNLDGAPVDASILQRMAGALRHRGPDGDGIHIADQTGLAHRRLAIIDLAGGTQPMSSSDARLWISFNGEIYNYIELQAELHKRGYAFRTSSDTETILNAYAEHGSDCVLSLRGMFAFALYDTKARRLLLARDRFGIKPLYYFTNDHVFVFGSELKALLQHPAVQREVDPEALSDYLTYLYVPAPRSILRGIRKLPAASLIEIQDGKVVERRYWTPTFEPTPDTLGEDEWIERLRSTLAESVRLHMRSDVPYGALLSGGLDSSTVVAFMAQQSTQPVSTYTVGFEESDFDERADARLISSHFGTRHTEVVLRHEGLSRLPELIEAFDEPFADPSALPCLQIAEVVARDLKVCLTGDGGDEAFAGYEAYRKALQLQALDRVPRVVRRALLQPLLAVYPRWLPPRGLFDMAVLDFADRYIELMCGFDNPSKRRILTPAFAELLDTHDSYDLCRRFLVDQRLDALSRMQNADYQTYLPDDILTKADRSSMRHSLELRVPLIDHKVFDLVRRLPRSLKIQAGTGKHLLRRAMEELLPPAALKRGKKGFAVPLQRWLSGELGALAEDVFRDRRTQQRGILESNELHGLLYDARRGHRDLSNEVWAALILELWCRHYLDCAVAEPSGLGSGEATAICSPVPPASSGSKAENSDGLQPQ
ncbi:MAG: asparagine synthase (glutamine-hydrolyzing) [Deltaproteobacteria bacterium]|nr:asparagine synthase (glutamine-hydrolyzing) [Deltaproteobacteria bacterium]